MNWWRLVLDFLPLSWMLLPALAVLLAPAPYVRAVAIAAGVFYAGLLVVGYLIEDQVCGGSCAEGLVIVPMYLLGVILTGIVFAVRASRASRK